MSVQRKTDDRKENNKTKGDSQIILLGSDTASAQLVGVGKKEKNGEGCALKLRKLETIPKLKTIKVQTTNQKLRLNNVVHVHTCKL